MRSFLVALVAALAACAPSPLPKDARPSTSQPSVAQPSLAVPASGGDTRCDSDAMCSSLPICDTSIHRCVACNGDHASGATLACDAALPACLANGSCAQCHGASDCAGLGQTCIGNACAPCSDDAQCTTGRCLPSGACAPQSSVLRVDNGPACGDGTHSDGKTIPYCAIGDAIPDSGQFVLQLAASAIPYGSVSIKTSSGDASLDLAIVGAGPDQTTLGVGDGDAVNLVAMGRPTTLTLRNLAVAPSNQTTGGGIACQGTELGGTLRLGEVLVEGTQGTGLSDSGCNLDVERSTVRHNVDAGIYVLDAKVTVQSTEVSYNGSSGISFIGGASGTLSHVTVVGNLDSSGAAGVSCQGGTTTISDSVVVLNGIEHVDYIDESAAANLDAACTVERVATGTTGSAGLACAPAFVDTLHGDFHIDTTSVASVACVVDQGSIDHGYLDHDGTGMLGAATDLGAYEAE